jgi:putative ABC transport system permease protein
VFDLDKWNEILTTIRKHKLRTALTAFGVFWGIFMLIVLLGASKGLENGVVKNFDIAKNTVFVWTQRTSEPYKGLKAGRIIHFSNDDIQSIKDNVPEVGVIAPRVTMDGSFTVTRNTKSSSFSVYGETPDFIRVKKVNFTGRFINNLDLLQRRKVCVVGPRVVEVLFQDKKEPIGEYIKIKGIPFLIVGSYTTKAKGEEALDDAQTIFIPTTTLQNSFNKINRIDYFAFLPKEGIPAADVQDKVKKFLNTRLSIAPNDERAIGSFNVEAEFLKVQTLFSGMRSFSWLVSIGTILAGVIGVGNIMLIVVKERTKEIGIRKALGATPASIIGLVMQESIVITAGAGFIGLVFGVGLVEGINLLLKKFKMESGFFSDPEVNFQVALAALVILIVTGALAGLIPAFKAVSIAPVEALRDE